MRIAAAATIAALVGCTKKNIRECEGNQNCTAEPGGICRTYPETGSRWCSYPDSECESGYRWGDVTVGDDLADTCVDGSITGVDAAAPPPDAAPCRTQVSWSLDNQVWVADSDGSNPQMLVPAARQPHAWSPLGDKLAYQSEDDRIWVIDADGSNAHPVSTGGDSEPHWSPDGARVVYRRGNTALWTVDADGSFPMAVTQSETLIANPAWSPDGEYVAFTGQDGEDTEVIVRAIASNSRLNLTNSAGVDYFLGWSPTGDRVLFKSSRSGTENLWIADRDGANPTNLETSGAGAIYGARWALGETIVFGAVVTLGVADIYRINADGTSLMVLDDTVGSDINPDLSTDGTTLAWAKSPIDGGHTNVWVANADGSNPVRVSNNDSSNPTLSIRFRNCP
jgi:Tol biopolymer transport system component